MEQEINKTSKIQQNTSENPAREGDVNNLRSNLIQKIKNKKALAIGGIVLIAILTIIVVLFILVRSKTGNINEVGEKIDQANIAYENGNLDEAEKLLVESYEDVPTDPMVQAALISVIANKGNQTGTEQEAYEKALPYIERALQENPNDYEVLLSVGYANEIAGKYEEALSYYEKAGQINPQGAKAFFHVGHVLEFLNRQDESFTYYEKAYSLDPTDPLINMTKAKVDLSSGNTESAFDIYIKASELPNSTAATKSEALTNASIIKRGNLLNLQEALDLSQRAMEANSQFSPAFAAHGFNLGLNGEGEQGIGYLKKAIELNPRISNNYWQTGLLYRAIQDYPQSINYIQQAIDHVDNDNTLLGEAQKNNTKAMMTYNLAQTKYWNGEREEVVELVNEALLRDPSLKSRLDEDYNRFGDFTEVLTAQQVSQLTL